MVKKVPKGGWPRCRCWKCRRSSVPASTLSGSSEPALLNCFSALRTKLSRTAYITQHTPYLACVGDDPMCEDSAHRGMPAASRRREAAVILAKAVLRHRRAAKADARHASRRACESRQNCLGRAAGNKQVGRCKESVLGLTFPEQAAVLCVICPYLYRAGQIDGLVREHQLDCVARVIFVKPRAHLGLLQPAPVQCGSPRS